MSFKRKLWWAQHRTDVYKYSTIVLLILIVSISIIYFTRSKFSSSNEMTMYETTVEPFIKNDYFIASYIDGEWSNEIPGKDDGYIVDKIVCDNGAVGTWDNDKWAITIENATKKIKCGVYFKKLVKLTEQITTLASTDTANFASDDPDSNIRYIGKNANSYVYFNCGDYSNQSDSTCEKWRIIGVFKNIAKADGTKEDLVKLRRNEALPYDISFDNYGSSNYSNNWETSSIKQMLNDSYYNSLTAKNIYDRDDSVNETIIDFSSSGLKNNQTRNSIESVVWNLGGVPDTNLLPSDFYSYERGSLTYGNNPVIWTGKIALPYISDYLYSVEDNSTSTRSQCLNIKHDEWFYPSYCTSSATTFGNSWYLDISSISGIAVPRIGGSKLILFEVGSGMTAPPGATPALYLKSDITLLKGDGSSANPYQLNLQ